MKTVLAYETVSGQRIECPDVAADVRAFIERVSAAVDDPASATGDVVALVYGVDNPIMDKALFPGRGAVTKDVLANPVYGVLTDLLFRKEMAARGQTAEELARPYTLTVAEAAKQIGIHETAVRRAIADKRLPAWFKTGRYYLDPSTFYLLGVVGQRGPLPAGVERLEVRVGHQDGVKLAVKGPGDVPPPHEGATEGFIERWRRVAVTTGRASSFRFFQLEPAAEANEVSFHGFYVRGKFRVVRRENNAARARTAWDEFQPG